MDCPYIDAEPVVRLNDMNQFEVMVRLAGVPDGLWENMLDRAEVLTTTTVTAQGGVVRITLQHESQVKGALNGLVAAIPVVHEAWESRQAIAVAGQQVASTWWAENDGTTASAPVPQEVGEGFDYSMGDRPTGGY